MPWSSRSAGRRAWSWCGRSRTVTGGTAINCKQGAAGRFWGKVDKTGRCWLWLGAVSENGYGRFRLDGRTVYAHRLAYQLCVGPIRRGMTIDHLCRSRTCVRPSHLEQVTNRVNIIRGHRVRRFLLYLRRRPLVTKLTQNHDA